MAKKPAQLVHADDLGRMVANGVSFTAFQGVHNNWRVFMTDGGKPVEVTETMIGAFERFDHVHGRARTHIESTDFPSTNFVLPRTLRTGGPVYLDLGSASDPHFSLARWIEAIASKATGKDCLGEITLTCVYT